MELVELRQKKGELWHQAQEIHRRAETENRAMNAEESGTWDRLNTEMDGYQDRIVKAERALALAKEMAEQQIADGRAKAGDTKIETTPLEYRGYKFDRAATASTEYRGAYAAYLREGVRGLGVPEQRALSVGAATQGGYTVMPQEMVLDLLKAVDNMVFVRQYGRVHPPMTQAASLGRISLDADPADADWTSELLTGSEDSTMAFGKREMRPHPLAKRIKTSKTLLRTSLLNIESLVRDRFAYKFSVTQEQAYLTGTGVQKPLGVFVASADGISTGRDVSTDNTSTAITADGLINAKFTLKTPYWARARWLFHRDAVKMIRKLKDGNGQYLWMPGLTGGVPDRILEVPYDISEYAPNTFTTGLYVGLIGDWQFYEMVDALSMEMQRLDELYAETNQVGFIARYEGDGMPTLEEAFVRVKLA